MVSIRWPQCIYCGVRHAPFGKCRVGRGAGLAALYSLRGEAFSRLQEVHREEALN